jgi:Flp pilus assembly protein TadB
MLCRASDFKRLLGFLLLAGVCLSVQWIALGMASVWLPGLAVLAAILAALVAPWLVRAPKPDREIKIQPARFPEVAKLKAPAKKAAP